MAENIKKAGIYFHWPYCKSKCPYCDFYKEIAKNIPQEEIIDSYIADLDFYHGFIGDEKIVSVFFGGGTPSLIRPELIEKLLNHIAKKFSVAKNPEISLEANPNTDKPNLFADLKNAGINRLSLGVQSFDDDELHFLGRTHTAAQAKRALDEVLSVFDNHSADLMYALPHQTAKKWQAELEYAAQIGLKHISLYQLTIEDGTVFQKKGIVPMNEENAARLYLYTEDFLRNFGYEKYEVSNYAKKGFASKHNLLYWQGDDYIGIGKSAHGRIGLRATEHHRQIYELTPFERAEELLIMGIRLTQGIDKQKFFQICGIKFDDFINRDFLAQTAKEKLLIDDKEFLRATPQGFLILNYLTERLCPNR